MAGKRDLVNIWKNIQEVDLRPIRESAKQEVKIALVGASGSGRRTLAGKMRSDSRRPDITTRTPVIISELNTADQARYADLIVLIVDVTQGAVTAEQALLDGLFPSGKQVIVFFNKLDKLEGEAPIISWLEAGPFPKIYGSALDDEFLQREFVPHVARAFVEQNLALGRHFPLFREYIARELITDACLANAAYSVGTGLAEIVPILDIPLNVADIIILTKAQAMLVYKLGLALGMPLDWQYYLGEFGSVVGSGFLWRQVARSLVGVIPVWGIVPKVAVAYSGTYVVGNVVLQWYLTGRHVSKKRMRELSQQAFAQGKTVARSLLEKVPRPRLKRKKQKALPPPPDERVCPACATTNDTDANFCKSCGQSLAANPAE